MTTTPAHTDGCTYFIDGTWRHCCDSHDAAYATNTVTLQSHIDLGICVAQTTGGPLLGLLMALATLLWWLLRHRNKHQP